MMKLSRLIFIISFSIVNIHFVSGQFRNRTDEIEQLLDSAQVLLTNEYEFKNGYALGASSFLLKAKNKTVLCTAKHLLGEAMGIFPEVEPGDFDNKLKYWKSFSRRNHLSEDTVSAYGILNTEIDDVDIMLLKIDKETNTNIRVLEPRFSQVLIGEKLTLIGCEYVDSDCNQKTYSVTAYSRFEGMLIIKCNLVFDISGFSGAPVVDRNGLVVGVVHGGYADKKKTYISVEPFRNLKKWLK